MNHKTVCWTVEKRNELRKLYPVMDRNELGKLLGCFGPAITTQANRMGLKKTIRQPVRKEPEPKEPDYGIGRKIATGTVYIRRNVLTHIST